MTDLATTVAPPQQSAARRFSQQVHVLVDVQTREFLLGLAIENAGDTRPREGETVRDLLDDAIARLWKRDPKGYERAVRRGRAELAERAKRARRLTA